MPPPGVVTAFATGEFNQHDGLTDLAMAVGGPKGPAILILQSTEGALISGPEILTLASRANSLTTGQLDDQAPFDLAVAAGSELLIVSGRDRA